MSSWFFFALVGHVANGAAFVIDKTLLRGSFKRPATYAALIGLLSIIAGVLFPFGVHVQSGTSALLMGAAGTTFVISLWAFFAALSRGEATRVVPIIGSLIPIATLGGTWFFLGERLTAQQGIGFALLLVATAILSGGGKKGRLSGSTIGMAIIAALLFAFSSVTMKAAYDMDGFITTFTVSRMCAAFMGAGLLLIDRRAFAELKAAFGGKKPARTAAHNPLAWVIGAQVLGGVGFLGVQYATSLGSAALVNALQAVQYAFLVAIALVLRKAAPTLLGEEVTVPVIVRKLIAIAFVAVGLWYVV